MVVHDGHGWCVESSVADFEHMIFLDDEITIYNSNQLSTLKIHFVLMSFSESAYLSMCACASCVLFLIFNLFSKCSQPIYK